MPAIREVIGEIDRPYRLASRRRSNRIDRRQAMFRFILIGTRVGTDRAVVNRFLAFLLQAIEIAESTDRFIRGGFANLIGFNARIDAAKRSRKNHH